ncbi:MAG: M23 family metallopeptidase [Verrucomicrobiales bacterium]|nr:M23 family metallopeptidase [Verrucomicrobiales bacterium]
MVIRDLFGISTMPACLRFLLVSSFLLFGFPIFSSAQSTPVGGLKNLRLPTDNDAIFSNDPSKFYMYTYRTFEGKSSRPWSGGQYGFTRNQKRTDRGIIFTKFHEGVDIRPVKRDKSDNPLDDVRSILDGTVVYVNDNSSASSYGKYIVIHHDWGEGPFFSLYAHLMSTSAKSGQRVKVGTTIGRLGYTGAGINRERAHLHLELAMLMSDRFQSWYGRHFTSKNHHGIYNGFNLIGIDVARLYHAQRADPNITMAGFFSKKQPYYKVTVKKPAQFELLRRYPWLGREMDKAPGAPSWEITFAGTGVPLAVEPSTKPISYPAVTWVKPANTNHSFHTISRITGTGSTAKLSASGSRFIQLLTGAF